MQILRRRPSVLIYLSCTWNQGKGMGRREEGKIRNWKGKGVVVEKNKHPTSWSLPGHFLVTVYLYNTHNYRRRLDLGTSNKNWSSGGYSSTCGAFSYFILWRT